MNKQAFSVLALVSTISAVSLEEMAQPGQALDVQIAELTQKVAKLEAAQDAVNEKDKWDGATLRKVPVWGDNFSLDGT